MSTYMSRPQVQKVATAHVPSGAALAASLIAEMRPSMDRATHDLLLRIARVAPPKSASAISPRPELPKTVPLPKGLGPVEKVKLQTLAQIASVPCLVDNPTAFTARLHAFAQSRTLDAAVAEKKRLLEHLEEDHHHVFLRALADSCAKAGVAAGFPQIARSTGPLGELRVIASDAQGRSLVTEIHVNRRRDVSLESEVAGVPDDSCHALMARFEEELERLGVRSGPPQRRPTGGAAQLAATREFLRKKVDSGTRRAQRLNQQVVVRVTK